MYEGFASLGGVELLNNERYATRAAALGLPVPRRRCPTLRAVLADDPYTAINAPWADPGTAEAAGFAGLLGSSITGLDQATATREITETVGDTPAIPGRARSGARTMLVTAFAAATSPASLAYGLAWLRSVLQDDCADACNGATLCMLAECPECDTSSGPLADTCWEAYARTLHDVVCIDGPKVISRRSLPGCSPRAVGATIEFTLLAAVPHIYRTPVALETGLAFTDPAPDAACETIWVPTGPGRQPCPPATVACPPPVSCLTDPYARPLPALPAAPAGHGACITRSRSSWALATAPANLLPRWLDSVPVLTVTAGDADLRRLTVRFHPNPQLRVITEPGQLDPCSALAEINLTYLPRDTVLVLDGRSQQAYVRCPGGVIERADNLLYGPDGGPWEWPLLTCGGALSVLALVDAEYHSAAARLDVELATRQDLA